MRRYLGPAVVVGGAIIAVVVLVLLLQTDIRGPHPLSELGDSDAGEGGLGGTGDGAADSVGSGVATPSASDGAEALESRPTPRTDESVPPQATPRPAPRSEPTEPTRTEGSPRSEDRPSREAPIPPARRPAPPPRRPHPSPPPADAEPPTESAMVESIRDQFNTVSPGIRQCYHLLLALEPEASDRLIFALRLTADPDDPERGVVELEGIESDQLLIEDLACFAEVVDAIELPPPGGGQEEILIRYPVVLNAGPP